MPISGVLTSWTVWTVRFPERRPWLFQDVAALILGQFGQVLDFFIGHVFKDIEAVQDGIGIGDIDDGQFGTICVGNVDGMLQGVARRLGTVNRN